MQRAGHRRKEKRDRVILANDNGGEEWSFPHETRGRDEAWSQMLGSGEDGGDGEVNVDGTMEIMVLGVGIVLACMVMVVMIVNKE